MPNIIAPNLRRRRRLIASLAIGLGVTINATPAAASEGGASVWFSAGLRDHRFIQLTGDSGSGAVLGPNKGRVTGLARPRRTISRSRRSGGSRGPQSC